MAFSTPRPDRKNITLANWANTASITPNAPRLARPVRFVARPATISATRRKNAP
ncbi:MAG: hypothetical protein P8Z36_15845 [Gemmatimonadota bacterium]